MILLLFVARLLLASGLLYGYYHFFLRNRGFHRFNRVYLLLAAIVPAILPFVTIPLLPEQQAGGSTLVKTLRVISFSGWTESEGGTDLPAGASWLTLQNMLLLLYAAGMAACLFIVVRSLVYIAGIRERYRYESIGDIRLYDTAEPGTPFSFFRLIFWNRDIPLHSKQGRQIFRHELFHVKQGHSRDIVLLELLCCIAWFNPFFHLVKKELKAIHEFLADDYAVSRHNRLDYAELLLTYAISRQKKGLPHPFGQTQIKRRVLMLTQYQPARNLFLTRRMALPLLLVLFSAFATVPLRHATVTAGVAAKPLVVVIDAGHGGNDPGAVVDGGMAEKTIALALAKQINEMAPHYNIRVVMTRSADVLPGNTTDIKTGLRKRVTIAEQEKADLFISLHVNADEPGDTSQPGIIAFVSGRRPDSQARLLASALLQQLGTVYTTSPQIFQRTGPGIWVLDHTPCPAVLLECGNLSVPGDVSFITLKDNQEKIARQILQGIVNYSNAR
jgi:N-acetylmuramoyl-L-alanine amidase